MNVESRSIRMRFVEETDAAFILSLRLDERYNRFLSEVDSDLEKQKSWIRSYKQLEAAGEQYYFVIERTDGTRCGTVRIYDIRGDSFCWGSWILNQDKTRYAALESALLVYDVGFERLGFKKSHFDVRKDNKAVISFHERLGATIIREDDENYFFEVTREAIAEKSAPLMSRIFGS